MTGGNSLYATWPQGYRKGTRTKIAGLPITASQSSSRVITGLVLAASIET